MICFVPLNYFHYYGLVKKLYFILYFHDNTFIKLNLTMFYFDYLHLSDMLTLLTVELL